MKKFLYFACCFLIACNTKEKADLVVTNGAIYTIDSSFSMAEAMAIRDGKIIATGTKSDISTSFDAKETLDAHGAFIYPGLIDAHAHFLGYALDLNSVNLTGAKSWEECIQRIQRFLENKRFTEKAWIVGRGWDQNDWPVKQFPDRASLDSLFPANPVLLTRVDGHAAIANKAALDISSLNGPRSITGGEVEVKNGRLTGILIDNAIDLVSSRVPTPDPSQMKTLVMEAQQQCFAQGLTTIDDCGLSYQAMLFLDSLQRSGELRMRFYVMLSDHPANFEYLIKNGAIKKDRLNVRSFKVYGDGALGSRGACLIKPYSDAPGRHGFLLSSKEHFDSVANLLSQHKFQMCTHAIGDSGNRVILNTYAKYLKGKNDLRWRIEHAQVVDPNDFAAFENYSIIPSVQPTHATSDMYWAEERLGSERVKTAYAYKQLLDQNGWIPLGTDFPVEDISPFKTFYAAVIRKDASGWPKDGFQTENALSRVQALRGMTIWAAKSNFEENEKGSLEKGKFADFILLDKNLMTANPEEILQTSVIATYVQGEKVYQRNK